jgi:2-oxoglutarate dehydrogenase E2 component (dihydrolipoamide succinyltransferase)
MSERVTMPALGESVTEGTVTRWLKQVGDTVAVDEPLLEVSTDKVDTEIPSPVGGTLQEILVGEDATVPVGADLAVIGEGAAGDGGSAPAQPSAEQPADDQSQAEQPSEPAGEDAADPAEPQTQPQAEPQAEPQAQPQAQEPAEQQSGSDTQPAQAAAEAPSTEQDAPAPAPAAEPQASSNGSGTTVTMPALGESVTEGTVTRWLKAEGDSVEVDEPLLEVSTDKVDTEVPSPVAGTVQKILVREDETVPVGADLVVVGSGSAAQPTEAHPAEAQEDESQQDESQQAEGQQAEAQESVQQQVVPEPDPQPEPEPAPEPQAPSQSQAEPEQQAEQPQQPAAAPPYGGSGGSGASGGTGGDVVDAATYVTPLVRKLAGEHGVELGEITGTGVGGRIRKQDVLDAAKAREAAAAEPAPAASAPAASSAPGAASRPPAEVSAKRGTTEKMTRLRKVIAQRMVESLQVSAQLTTVVEVDVTKISRLRDRAKSDFQAREGVKLSFLPFFALAVVEALKIHPMVNASIDGDEVTYHGQENLGIAVDTERGLLVPVIKDAGDLNIAGLARKIADLAERTRTSKIVPDELGGGTFTLTNTGSRGALFDTPIINQPQVGILGTGSVVRRPVVVADPDGGETIAIRSMVFLALSYDHRIVDGADAARFLTTVKERLEDGAFDSDLGL